MTIWIVSLILVLAIILLITEKIPIDLTALGIIVALLATGVLSAQEAVIGFANPAVITVGAMFMISRALMRTGALGFVGEKMIAYSKGNSRRVMIMSLSMVAVASAFINNTPVVVLFISILMSVCCEYGLSPSRFMIPVSYASILAGTCTLIGTSTNILVSDLSFSNGYGAIGMFELASLGMPIAVLGVIFLYFAAPNIMPGHMAPVCELRDSEDRRYLAELSVPEGSHSIGKRPADLFAEKYPTMEVFEVIRDPNILFPEAESARLAPGDILLVKASANDLIATLDAKLLQLPLGDKALDFSAHGGSLLVELIIPPQSGLVGSRLMGSPLQLDPDIKIIAVKRRRTHYSKQKLRQLRITVGDILLVHCPKDHLEQFRGGNDFIVVEDVQHQIINKKKAPLALAIFIGMVVSATAGLADIMICAVAAVFLMLLGGCLQLREAYRSVDVRVLLTIVGTLALGLAMHKTGTAKLYAEGFLSLFHGQNPTLILSAFILITSLSSQALSNNATAVLLIPIGISTALSLGVNPKPFIIAICFGASACYATPIGYQTNLLVYGPGGYRFSDYMKLGIPLTLLVWLMGSWFIPKLWPF
jgi:di/tricarboxylate transporter